MDHYPAFLLIAALAVISPGPAVALTLCNAVTHGTREAMAGILGMAVGALVVGLAASSGLGALLSESGQAEGMLKSAGAAYLIYLGGRRWWASSERQASGLRTPHSGFSRRVGEGLLLQLTNPKTLLFMFAVFPQFIAPREPALPQFLAMTLTFSLLDVVVHSGYALVARRARAWLDTERGAHLTNRVTGTLFVLLGVALAVG